MAATKLPPIPGYIARPINLIVIHCSGTASGQSISTAQKNAAQVIDDWHRARNFKRVDYARSELNYTLSSIGYHYIIDLDGFIFTGRGINEAGAHAQGFNRSSIGICLIGGKEREGRYTLAQWQSLSELTQALSSRFKVSLHMPDRSSNTLIKNGVCGHRDLSHDQNGNGLIEPFEWTKTCPGFSVDSWLSNGCRAPIGHIFVGSTK